MPVDPMIARPYVPQFGNTLGEIARTKVADDYRNALMEQERREHAFRQQQYYDQQAQEDEDDREWDTAYAARDWATLARLDPQTTRVLMEHEKAQQPAPVPGPITTERQPDGAAFYLQDGKVVGSRMPLAPPQYAPEQFSEYTDAEGSVYLIGSRGTIRPTELRGKVDVSLPAPVMGPEAAATRRQGAENVLASVTDAEIMAGTMTTGLIGSVLGNVPGSSAYDLRQAIDTIKANIGFDRLQRMREESKTGGALGQVAVQELEMLQKTIDSLDPNQSEKALREALVRVRAQYERAMTAYDRMLQSQGSPTQGLPSIEDRVKSYYGTGL